MTHDNLIECPAEGCDFVSGKKAVFGHWGGREDSEHSGSLNRVRRKKQMEKFRASLNEEPSLSELRDKYPGSDFKTALFQLVEAGEVALIPDGDKTQAKPA